MYRIVCICTSWVGQGKASEFGSGKHFQSEDPGASGAQSLGSSGSMQLLMWTQDFANSLLGAKFE